MGKLSKEIDAWLRSRDNFLIVSHVNPDGDATGSLLAIMQILKQYGKKGTMMNESSTPSRFSFLPDYESIINYEKAGSCHVIESIICVDCADQERVGKVAACFSPQAEILNIDHHPTNDSYGTLALLNPDASSTCEVIYDWVREIGIDLTRELAQCLYTGYLTDTGGFRYSNTTPKVLRDASELVEFGAHPYETAERALESISFEHIQLLSRALSLIERSEDGKVVYLALPLSVLKETGALKEDAEGLVNYGRNIEGVEVAVFMRETEDGVKVSLRSKSLIDVSQIAKELGGGGHMRASGCFLPLDLASARQRIEPLIVRKLQEEMA